MNKRIIFALFMALGSAGVGARHAHADWLEATLEQPLVELSHHVDVSFERGVAYYKVQRTFLNKGDRHDEASLRLKLPYGATATGLKIRAGDVWYDAELMDAEVAAARYSELTGLGRFAPKDPALLSWSWADELHLRVFPVPPKGVATVAYTLAVPTSYQEGRARVFYPMREPDRDELADPTLSITHEDKLAATWLNGQRVAQQQVMILKPQPRHAHCEGVAADDASCVVTQVDVPSQPWPITKLELELNIKHTYPSDLALALRSPGGKLYALALDNSERNDLVTKVQVELEPEDEAAGAWSLILMDVVSLDSGRLDAWRLRPLGGGAKAQLGQWQAGPTGVFIPDADANAGVAQIEAAPREDLSFWAARLGAVRKIKDKEFMRVELDMARQISKMPKAPHVVFVLDGSYSAGAEGWAAQLRLIEAFLGHVPDASVELIVYQRQAQQVFGRFVSPQEVSAKLAAWRAPDTGFALANGSALDAAMRLGLERLKAQPQAKSRYMLILGDDLVRSTYEHKAALELLKQPQLRGVNVHALRLNEADERQSYTRDESILAAPLALRQGGLALRLTSPHTPDKEDLLNLTRIGLELVRPTRLDLVQYSAQGVAQDTFKAWPKQLHEGQGLREFLSLKRASPTLVVEGRLWNKKIKRTINNDRTFERLAMGWVFSHDLYDDLTNEEQFIMAMAAGVVSPMTSFLAVEPGVRPSTVGIEGRGGGSGGFGMRGLKGRRGGGLPAPPALGALIEPRARKCAEQHNLPSPWLVTLHVETTGPEIVDVGLTQAPNDKFGQCVVDAVWAMEIQSYSPTLRLFDMSFKG